MWKSVKFQFCIAKYPLKYVQVKQQEKEVTAAFESIKV